MTQHHLHVTALGTAACLAGTALAPLLSRLGRVDDLGLGALVLGPTPTSFALATAPVLGALLLGATAAALVTRRARTAVAATAAALLLGCLGHLAAGVLTSGRTSASAVLVGLLLSALVALPVAAVAGRLAGTPWGRLVVVAAVLAPSLLVALQQVLLAGGGGWYAYEVLLLTVALAVALAVGVALGGGSGRVREAATRLPVALGLLLVGGAVLPVLSVGLVAAAAGTLPRGLDGGVPAPRLPAPDQLLLPVTALPLTWPAWVGGVLVGALVGGGVLVGRRVAARRRRR